MNALFKILNRNPQRKPLFALIAFLILGVIVAVMSATAQPPPLHDAETIELSTFIPKNYTLIPIELKNSEQLEGVLGSHGIVDLFQSVHSGSSSLLIAKRLRIIRAPLNPHAFAVLVRDEEAHRILSRSGPFVASLRSSDQQPEHAFAGPQIRGPSIEFAKENP